MHFYMVKTGIVLSVGLIGLAILEALSSCGPHPSAEQIIEKVRKEHPKISVATVYKVLETLVAKKIISKVKTDKDSMRYDAVVQSHHHIYCSGSEQIDDYFDEELDDLLVTYFIRKKITGFTMDEVRLQIIGKYNPVKK